MYVKSYPILCLSLLRKYNVRRPKLIQGIHTETSPTKTDYSSVLAIIDDSKTVAIPDSLLFTKSGRTSNDDV